MLKIGNLYHIVPAIGTIFYSRATEKRRLRQYRFENFDAEWFRLVNESSFAELKYIYLAAKKPMKHMCASNTLGLLLMAKEFFNISIAPLDNMNSFEVSRAYFAGNQDQADSYHYLRAFCRTFLSDYICMGYSLPLSCVDIADDIIAFVKKSKKFRDLIGPADNSSAVFSNGMICNQISLILSIQVYLIKIFLFFSQKLTIIILLIPS